MHHYQVLRVITRLNIGGPARQALLLTKALSDFPTALVAGSAPDQEGELLDPEVPVRRVHLVRPVRPADDLRAAREIHGILRGVRPALVHSHMAKAGALTRSVAQLIRPRPRLVHTFHGHVLEGYFSPVLQRAFVETERRLARHTDVLVAVSPEVRNELLEIGIGRPEQYRVIRLGLHLEDHLAVEGPTGALRERLGLGPEVPLIGSVGRLAPIKDLETLLRAMTRLPACHLAVLGDGEQRSFLEAQTARLGLGDRVHFLGWWLDVASAMSDMDVVALSSRNEGTPVALIEAAACALPVVATDVGGVRSVVEDGVTGFLVPAGDDTALADRVGRLLGDGELRRQMGLEARRRTAPRFTAERLVNDIRALYEELLAQ